jgi:hypothetical protein
MCWAVANIAWSMVDGGALLKHTEYDGRSNYEWALQTLLQGVHFLIKCHVREDAFVIQARPSLLQQ